MDINALLASLGAATDNSNNQLLDISKLMGAATANEQAVNTKAQAGAAADIPVASGIANQTADVAYQQAQLIQQQQRQAGLDPTVAENAYTEGLANLTAINSQRAAAAEEITKLSSLNLFDNPVGYLFAQLNLPTAVAKAQGLEQQAAVVKDDLGARLELLSKAKSTVTANTADAMKEINYQTSSLKAREAQRQLDLAGAATQSKIAGQYLQQVNVLDKINDNKRQMVSMQIQAANFATNLEMQREARAAAAEATKARLADKKTKDDAEAMFMTSFNAGRKLLGQPGNMTMEDYKASQNTPQKKALSDLAVNGTLGSSLYDSLITLQAANPNLQGIVAGGNAGFAKTLDWLNIGAQSFVSAAGAAATASGQKLSAKVLQEQGVNDYQVALQNSASDPKGAKALTSPLWDSTPNIYKAQYKVMIDSAESGTIPGLKGNVVVEAAKTLLPTIPAEAPNFRSEDEMKVWNQVGMMVAKKQININDAAKQVSQFYRASAAHNQKFFQYTLTGLPAQNSYMVKLQTPGIIYGTNPVPAGDAMNEVAVKNMLLVIAKAQSMNVPLNAPIPSDVASSSWLVK